MRALTVLVATMAFSCLSLHSAYAQPNAGAASLQVPVDARMEGMGQAYGPLSTGAFAAWYNAAGLGFTEGLHLGFHTAKLVPDLADDVRHTYVSAAYGSALLPDLPVNVALNLSYNRLNYGEVQVTGPGGPDPITTVEPIESTVGLAAGLGIADILAVGGGVKFFSSDFKAPLDDPAKASATTFDYGVQVQTPALPGPNSDRSLPDWQIRAKAGMGWSNRGGELEYVPGTSPDPMPAVRRGSVGVDLRFFPLANNLPQDTWCVADRLRDRAWFNVRIAVGRETEMTSGQDYKTNHQGFEVSVLDLFSFRKGRVYDPVSGIEDDTNGYGFNFLGYAGFDYANIPQHRDLDRVKKYTFWVRVPLGS